MNFVTIVFGFVLCGYAIFSFIMRNKKPELFKKLEPMKEKWGSVAGNRIHLFGYVILPFILGIIFIVAGFLGKNIFEIIL